MSESYLFINSQGLVFPCDKTELRHGLKHIDMDDLWEEWPSNSHGPAFPFARYKGVIVLDLKASDPTIPLTKSQILKAVE